ncbi:MAG: response regulator [Patescibacteria group bacterium]
MTELKRITVIDDEPAIREALVEMLSGAGFDVSSAVNGKEGLVVVSQQHPDLILLDIMMPEMNGWQVLEALKKDDWAKKVPVIILTNLDGVENVSKAVEQEAYEYVVKGDTDMKDILAMVKRRLGV